jgi:hypothetical protein
MLLTPLYLFFQYIWYRLCDPTVQKVCRFIFAIGLLVLCLNALADGNDLLQGTDASAWATLTGTGKKYIYMIEFVLAVGSYMTSRKLIVFTGFVVISVVIDIVLHFAGQSG